MKAQELRISNIIKEGEIMECSNLMARIRKSPSDYGLFTINKLHPLEITPELLEKAGFEKTKSSYEEAETYDFYKGIIYLDMANNSMKVNGVYALSFIPKYFHQLQNLYFDLTGEEITI